MSKEIKRVVYHVPKEIPEPYQSYIQERNGKVAKRISGILGVDNTGLIQNLKSQSPEDYLYPAKMVVQNGSLELNGDQLYGVVAAHEIFGDKISLHQTVSQSSVHPSEFSTYFADQVNNRDCVLPGYSVFTPEDALEGYERLSAEGFQVLMKNPKASDSDGQSKVRDKKHFLEQIEFYGRQNLRLKGLVLESCLEDPKTHSFGRIVMDNQNYFFVAEQYDIQHQGRTKFGGGLLTVFREGSETTLTQGVLARYYDQGVKVLDTYSHLADVATRYSVDVVHGEDRTGKALSGVTDITARPGGFSPGEILAVDHLRNSDLDHVSVDIRLDYDAKDNNGGEVFLDSDTLRITAEVLL